MEVVSSNFTSSNFFKKQAALVLERDLVWLYAVFLYAISHICDPEMAFFLEPIL